MGLAWEEQGPVWLAGWEDIPVMAGRPWEEAHAWAPDPASAAGCRWGAGGMAAESVVAARWEEARRWEAASEAAWAAWEWAAAASVAAAWVVSEAAATAVAAEAIAKNAEA